MSNSSATINYIQGGFFSIPKAPSQVKTAVKSSLLNALNNDFKVVFGEDDEIDFEDFSFELADHDDTETHFNFMFSFELNASFQTEGDAEDEAYEHLGFKVNGYEELFDVKHTEMTSIS